MKRYMIKFSYDGSNYNGYQKQPKLNTIQGQIESALKYINNKRETKLVSSGRTDAYVHANNQVGHFDLDIDITEYKLKCALNSLLPGDIYVKEAKKVKNTFHARYDVKSKEYVYLINTKEYNPVQRNYIYQYNKPLDIEKMKEASKYFIGEHDFSSFSSNEDKKDDNTRIIYNIKISEKDGIIKIRFKGSGFLKYMVRIIVGTLIEVGENKKKPIEVKKMLDAKDRTKVGHTANPEGLYLDKINY